MKARWVLGCLVVGAVAAASGVAVAGKDRVPPKAAVADKAKANGADQAGAQGAQDGLAVTLSAEAEADGKGAPPDPLAGLPHLVGPRRVELGHSAQIDLPAGMVLFEQAQAAELLRKGGNDVDGVLAMVVPHDGVSTWWLVIEASDVGYVSDDDANELDADALLDQYKRGTIEQNKKRAAMGVPALFIDGWSSPPRYELLKRRLVWGLNGHDKDGKVVNFFTRFLGRNGFLSVNLIDDSSKIEASKAQVLSVLTAIHYAPGARYEDHASGDKDSGLGLKSLVLAGTGVVIAKKTGILLAILLALKKGIIVVVAAIGAFFKRLFGRRKRDDDVALAMSGEPMPPPAPPHDDPSPPPSDTGPPPSDPPG